MKSSKNLFDRSLTFLYHKPWIGLSIAVIVAVAGIFLGRNIAIKLSLADLLPDTRESVMDLKAVSKEVGGVGSMAVVIGPTQNPDAKLPELAAAMQTLDTVRYAYYERETHSLRNKGLYLLERKEFDDLLSSTETLLSDGKAGGALDLGFSTEDENQEEVKKAQDFIAGIKKKYLGDTGANPKSSQYYVSDDGRYALLWLKPAFDSENIKLSRSLVDGVQQKAASVMGNTPFTLWGRSVNHVNDTNQIQKDVAMTSWVAFGIIALLLVTGLGGIRAAIITVLTVNLSMGWTLGFTGLLIGQVNIVTSFLIAILGGLGVEYGIHLIRRFYQNMDAGEARETAALNTYLSMTRVLLSAALTSAGAFLVLSFSDFRGFSEMGKIAGFGVLSIYIVYVLCFPVIVRLLRKQPRNFHMAKKLLGFYPFSSRWTWTLLPLLVVFGFGLSRAYFEYDFEKMRQLSPKALEDKELVHKINRNRTTTPAALMATDSTQARALHRWIETHPEVAHLHSVVSVENLLPLDMQERDTILSKYRSNISKISDKTIRDKTGLDPELIKAWVRERPYTAQDLPVQLRDAFGKNQSVVLAYTTLNLSQERGVRDMDHFVKTAKSEFPGVKSGSDSSVFVEILDHINHDGKIVMVLFLVGAFLVLFLDFGSFKEALNLEVQLILGIALLVALMGLFNVPFTILNIAMIPAVLAGGIDMGVHVRHRQLESGDTAIKSARFIAQAVNLGVLTTMVGFGSLFLAQAAMLKGIAWISCLGQASMYFICMFAWPVLSDFVRARLFQGRPPQVPQAHH
ncbi:MAG TPA: MMPL family transporter [Bdellovibrionota bacterium]|jgi:predicted RND superfamily exporter protein|nr:MMPL family transporter [Bdellovibrionota bacterium]